MKKPTHRKTLLVILLLMSASISMLLAQTSSFQVFLQKARQYQPYYLQKDSVMRMPFTGEQSEVSWYYEVAFDGGEATFLEEVFYGLNQKGHRMICRCETEKSLEQLEQKVVVWSKSSVRINMAHANFQQQYCLTETVDQPFAKTTAKIPRILAEKGSLPPASHEGLTLNGRWLKAEDGHWILDLSGQLPKGYTFLSFDEVHELHYIKGKETLLYPADYAPAWKRELISNGRFGKNMVNNPENNFNTRQNYFRPFSHGSGDQGWNLLFHWYDSLALQAQPREAAGVVYLSALSEESEEQSGPLSMLSPGKKWDISCDGKSIVLQNVDEPNQGLLRLGEGMQWEKIIIKDPSGAIVVSYNWGELGPSLQITPEAGAFYTMAMSSKKPVSMVVPFQGPFPTEEVLYAKDDSGQPVFQYFRRSQNDLTAAYELELPLNTQLKHFEISRAVDDQGKDLRIAANPGKRWVKMEYERYVKDVNQYELKMGSFALPSATASQVFLSGSYRLSTNWEEAQMYQWQDTLHLAKAAPELPKPPSPTIVPEDAWTAEYFWLYTMEGSLTQQGVKASIPFQIPYRHGSYYGLNADGSELLALTDDQGHDLMAAHRATFGDRLDAAKVSTVSYAEEGLNRENIIVRDWEYPGPDKQPQLNVHVYTGAGKGGSKILGNAKVLYYTYDEQQPKRTTHRLNITGQPSLVVTSADNTPFHFEYASFGTDAEDGSAFTKYQFRLPSVAPKYHLAEVVVKDQAGDIVSLQRHEAYAPRFQPYNLTFPEGEWGAYTVELIYHELEEHTLEVPFAISLGGG